MTSKPYDIVLIPEQRLALAAIKTSEELRKFGTLFTLDGKTFFPHVSLYMLQLKEADLEKVFALLGKIAGDTPTITGSPKLFGSHNNYIDVEYDKTTEIARLQMDVVEVLNPIRDCLRDKDKERLPTATEEEKNAILKYGYRSVGKLFEPHLTFTRFKDPQPDAKNSLPDMKKFDGRFLEMGIYEMGDNGTCVHEIKKWQLASFDKKS